MIGKPAYATAAEYSFDAPFDVPGTSSNNIDASRLTDSSWFTLDDTYYYELDGGRFLPTTHAMQKCLAVT